MMAFYFLLHVLLGAFAGFMGFYFKKLQCPASLHAKFLPYFLFIGIVIILAKCIWWVGNQFDLSELQKGLSTIFMFLSLLLGTFLGNKFSNLKHSK
ncbi:MAG TPA: hypothetical protein VIF10_05775 [Methylobacter sp.]|jgi:hypothetical protein